MSTRLIVFRTDASRAIGTGHVMRCATLASALVAQGATVAFICREHEGHLCDWLEARGFLVRRLPLNDTAEGEFAGFGQQAGFSPELPGVDRFVHGSAEGNSLTQDAAAEHDGNQLANYPGTYSGTHSANHLANHAGNPAPANPATLAHAAWLGCDWTRDAAQSVAAIDGMACQPEWLIVDHYALDYRWQRVVRTQVSRVMVIDDLADRQHDCDLLLDQNLVPQMATRYAQRVPLACTCLLGPQYALLQAQYADLRAQRKQRLDPPRRLFAYFGGFDPANLCGMTLDAFLALAQDPDAAADLQLDLVLPASSVHNAPIQRAAQPHANIHLYSQLPSLAPLMASADLALGAGGATTWERLCLGLPSLVVIVAENQRESALEQQAHGLVHVLGALPQVERAQIQAALARIMAEGVAALVPADLSAVVDGQGVARVLAALQNRMPASLQAHLEQQALQAGAQPGSPNGSPNGSPAGAATDSSASLPAITNGRT